MTRAELLVAADYHQEADEMEAALACLLCVGGTSVQVGDWWFDAPAGPGMLLAGSPATGQVGWYARYGWIDTAPPPGYVSAALEAALRLALVPQE